MHICFSLISFFAFVYLSYFKPDKVELEVTKHQTLSTCFSSFENLYFNSEKKTFMLIGHHVYTTHAFNFLDKRGYTFSFCPRKEYSIFEEDGLVIDGTSIILLEREVTPSHFTHFFHFLEHLLGFWNFGGEQERDDVKLFLIAGNGKEISENWKGCNQVTYHLIKALFPHAKIKTWHDFVRDTSGKVVCFQKAITGDRAMELFKKEPYHTDRMLGDYFQRLQADGVDHFSRCVQHYCGVNVEPSSKLRVTYVPRFRERFVDEAQEKELLERIGNMPEVILRVADFAVYSFSEQVAIAANTDVLIGAHGNGLSHTLFLPKGAAMIELFPKDAFRVEYRIFAKAHGIDYFGWIDSKGWISDEIAETVGKHGQIEGIINIDIDAIMDVILSKI
ncbi:MAG: glycosyltransferase family 61 protein [Chlamydiota bacterium]